MTEDWNRPVDLSPEMASALVEAIMQIHSGIIHRNGSQSLAISDSPETQGAVESAVTASLCSHFGQYPCDSCVGQIVKLSTLIAKDHCFPDGNKRTAIVVLMALMKFFVDEDATVDCSQETMADIVQQIASCGEEKLDAYQRALTAFVLDCLVIGGGERTPSGGIYYASGLSRFRE
ncbi:Fic family protein [Olsenella phocaeensis]|uniref:Fic family protein n=2 Tax=Olsenella phocaeensis TaxID=1852385 RepID=UPI00093158CF|nr:Fic family protein [Olsenella phocaeensis]